MAENLYNHGDPSISSSGGTVEELIRRGLILRDGNNTPKSENFTYSEYKTDKDGNQTVDRSKKIIVEFTSPYGNDYITLNGFYHKKFNKAFEAEAKDYLKAHGAIGDNTIYHHQYGENGSTVFTFKKEAGKRLAKQEHDVDILDIIAKYNETENIDDLLPEGVSVIPLEDVSYFLLKSMAQYEDETQARADLKVFNNETFNLPDFYFGNSLTDDNIGFYIDLSGRLRASYDSFVLYRAHRLILDLLENADEEEYVVGRLPSNTIQFVLEKPLTERLKMKFGSYNAMAARWNNPNAARDSLNGISFERIIDIKTKKLYNASDVFGYEQ